MANTLHHDGRSLRLLVCLRGGLGLIVRNAHGLHYLLLGCAVRVLLGLRLLDRGRRGLRLLGSQQSLPPLPRLTFHPPPRP